MTVFTKEEEAEFVQFMDHMKILRLPRTKKIFEFDIQFLVRYFQVPNPFTDEKPGKYKKHYIKNISNFAFLQQALLKTIFVISKIGYYWTMRFLKDNGCKFLTDAEAKLISDRILKLGEYVDECVSVVKAANSGMLLNSGKRLFIMELKMFVLDGNVKIALVVSI